jgi:hypothetical protein
MIAAFMRNPRFTNLGTTIEKALERTGRTTTPAARRFHRAWARAGLVPHWFQRPQLWIPDISARAFHDPDEAYPELAAALRANWRVIRDEAMAVLGDAFYEPQDWIRNGSMSQFVLLTNGL